MENKMPSVYLHIGMNKTGSTALQAWLSAQQQHLIKQGIYYPMEGLQGGAHYGLSDLLGFKHGTSNVNTNDVLTLKSALMDSVNKHQCHTVVFSSENFVINKDFSALKAFVENVNCKIVVYLRRHDYWYESAYNQSLKMVHQPKFNKGIEAYITHEKKVSTLGNYTALINRWVEAFGRENVIVRPYEKPSLPKGIVEDFLTIIGAEATKFPTSKKQYNVSLSKWANAILEVAQRSSLSSEQVNKVLSYLQQNDIEDTPYSLLSPKRRRRMLNNHLWQYQQIAEQFSGFSEGFFKEAWPTEGEPWQAFEPPTSEEIVSVIIKALK